MSSEISAGRMRLALVTDPAPGIWQGLPGSSFCSVAVVQSARISWYAWARAVGVETSSDSYQSFTLDGVSERTGAVANAGRMCRSR